MTIYASLKPLFSSQNAEGYHSGPVTPSSDEALYHFFGYT